MNLCLIGHKFQYELEKLIRIFMPFEKIEFFDCEALSETCAVTRLENDKAKAYLNLYGDTYNCEMLLENADEKEQELKLALCLYTCFVKATGYTPKWGILTGVRPAKL